MKFFIPSNYIKFFRRLFKSFLKNTKNKKLYSESFINTSIKKVHNVDELIDFHFQTYSEINHINKEMFKKLLNNPHKTKFNILETGSSAHGTNSSMLFISYVKKFGGTFKTIDINPDIKLRFSHLINYNIEFYTDDSIKFLSNLAPNLIKDLDVIYLDSFDLDIKNPAPSEKHGLKEFLLLDKFVKKGTLIAIDDTPKEFNLFGLGSNKLEHIPGKGALVLNHIKQSGGYEIIYHHYSLILKKT